MRSEVQWEFHFFSLLATLAAVEVTLVCFLSSLAMPSHHHGGRSPAGGQMVMDTLGVLWVYVQAWLSGMHLVQGTMSVIPHQRVPAAHPGKAGLSWATAGDLGGRQMSALSLRLLCRQE